MAFTHDPTTDRSVTLADGRTLACSEFGDPQGFPVVSNHGGLVCRFDAEPSGPDAAALGLRVISVDRPGVAGSDPKPGRDTLDWAADVAELLDALGVDRFATIGWSMGGQYALALAHAFPYRVVATAVVAGCLPLDDEATLAELNDMDRRLTKMSHDHPTMARTTFKALGALEDHFPERMARMSARKAGDADKAAYREQADLLGVAMAAACADTEGMVEEYRAWVRPWRFGLGDVSGPVAVWQGADDDLVPAAWGERMAAGLPNGELHALEGEGHLIGLTRRGEIMAALRETAGVD